MHIFHYHWVGNYQVLKTLIIKLFSDLQTNKGDSQNQAYINEANKYRLELRDTKEAEKVNKLRWQVCIGDDIPADDHLTEIETSRTYDMPRIGKYKTHQQS